MEFKVISFYKYIDVKDPVSLRDQLKSYCKENNILGRILLGEEGLNGAICGKQDSIKNFKTFIKQNPLFEDLTFREQDSDFMTYHKLVVRIRKEICAFGTPVDVANKAEYIEPKELEEWYNQNKDFIIIDVRNTYEYDVGHFKNATKVPTKVFSEFPEQAKKQLSGDKDKDIVLYCTGGIRCEKASAYLKEQGFEKVRHVKGGIINYVNQFPNSKWEGGLFVFDDRKVSSVEKPIADCVHCSERTNEMNNCFNIDCDKLVVICSSCQEKFNHSCSIECQNSKNRRAQEFKSKKLIEKKPVIATVENYFQKPKIALLKVRSHLKVGDSICISGKTTKETNTKITEMRDYDGNEIIEAKTGDLITIPVESLVRVNDLVC